MTKGPDSEHVWTTALNSSPWTPTTPGLNNFARFLQTNVPRCVNGSNTLSRLQARRANLLIEAEARRSGELFTNTPNVSVGTRHLRLVRNLIDRRA